MKQYLILGRDGSDDQALSRRLAARPAHFEKARALKASKNFLIGGAILDDNDLMVGSMMVMEFENETALQQWLDEEPYVLGQVWKSIEIKPFRVAEL